MCVRACVRACRGWVLYAWYRDCCYRLTYVTDSNGSHIVTYTDACGCNRRLDCSRNLYNTRCSSINNPLTKLEPSLKPCTKSSGRTLASGTRNAYDTCSTAFGVIGLAFSTGHTHCTHTHTHARTQNTTHIHARTHAHIQYQCDGLQDGLKAGKVQKREEKNSEQSAN